ncbi:MAG: dihydrofolate reductase family protein [Ginsengibacter sp.]
MMVSLDGFIEGPHKELDWHLVDNETEDFIYDTLSNVDGILLGRKSYDLLKDYWPSSDNMIAHHMNYLPKFVFSKTLKSVTDWKNTSIVNGNLEEQVKTLKNTPGKDLILFGGAEIATILNQFNLIDQYWLFVNPVILGSGTALFKDPNARLQLSFLDMKVFRNGTVLLKYIKD